VEEEERALLLLLLRLDFAPAPSAFCVVDGGAIEMPRVAFLCSKNLSRLRVRVPIFEDVRVLLVSVKETNPKDKEKPKEEREQKRIEFRFALFFDVGKRERRRKLKNEKESFFFSFSCSWKKKRETPAHTQKTSSEGNQKRKNGEPPPLPGSLAQEEEAFFVFCREGQQPRESLGSSGRSGPVCVRRRRRRRVLFFSLDDDGDVAPQSFFSLFLVRPFPSFSLFFESSFARAESARFFSRFVVAGGDDEHQGERWVREKERNEKTKRKKKTRACSRFFFVFSDEKNASVFLSLLLR
jgi:hypothetical protein